MSYTVTILRRAQKELADLPVQEAGRVVSAINALVEDPRPPGCLKLSGCEGWRQCKMAQTGRFFTPDAQKLRKLSAEYRV